MGGSCSKDSGEKTPEKVLKKTPKRSASAPASHDRRSLRVHPSPSAPSPPTTRVRTGEVSQTQPNSVESDESEIRGKIANEEGRELRRLRLDHETKLVMTDLEHLFQDSGDSRSSGRRHQSRETPANRGWTGWRSKQQPHTTTTPPPPRKERAHEVTFVTPGTASAPTSTTPNNSFAPTKTGGFTRRTSSASPTGSVGSFDGIQPTKLPTKPRQSNERE